MSHALAIDTSQLPAAAPSTQLTTMQLAHQLISNGASLDAVKEMLAMSRELAADEARQKFDAAMSAAKAEITPIVRNATGNNDKKYADFAAVAKAVDPIISRHGLSYRFRTKQDDRIHVTCILAHEAGHAEETTLSGPPDDSGKKNAIQAIGSTLTYLQRYSLVQALGLAAATDDDGKAAGRAGNEAITPEQVEELQRLIDRAVAAKGGDRAEWLVAFLDYMKVDALLNIPASAFGRAKKEIEHAIRQGASHA